MPPRKFQPTDELRERVKTLAGCGMRQREICQLIGLRSRKTLRKHFRKELELGPVEALVSVKRTAFRLATSGRNPRMTKRWLQQRARWSPNMRSRDSDGARHWRWVVETYRPPRPPEDAAEIAALLSQVSTPTREWDGDSAEDGTNQDGG